MLFSSARSSVRLLFSLGMKQPCPDSVSEALRNKQRIEQTRKNLYGKSRIHRAVNTNTEIAQTESQHAAQSASPLFRAVEKTGEQAKSGAKTSAHIGISPHSSSAARKRSSSE